MTGAPDSGWTWKSHMLESMRQKLHLNLAGVGGEPCLPVHVPETHSDEGWWEQRSAAISRCCYLQVRFLESKRGCRRSDIDRL